MVLQVGIGHIIGVLNYLVVLVVVVRHRYKFRVVVEGFLVVMREEIPVIAPQPRVVHHGS